MGVLNGIKHGSDVANTASTLGHFGTSAAGGKLTSTAANAEMDQYSNMILETQLHAMKCQFIENLGQVCKEVGGHQM
ncbi:type III secretion pilus protein SctF (plasmid) [Mycetohabitans rhizoxinica]|uniref:type III secretion pilus protein SctF n=1 Tax=Mycetohabitans rhizoxinica TaxID=412963 RepID=UPI0030CFFB4A